MNNLHKKRTFLDERTSSRNGSAVKMLGSTIMFRLSPAPCTQGCLRVEECLVSFACCDSLVIASCCCGDGGPHSAPYCAMNLFNLNLSDTRCDRSDRLVILAQVQVLSLCRYPEALTPVAQQSCHHHVVLRVLYHHYQHVQHLVH